MSTAVSGDEPLVAVIVPTCREPVPLILRTVQSVYEQDYPADRPVVIVSDDSQDPVLRRRLTRLFPDGVYCARPILTPQVVTVLRRPAIWTRLGQRRGSFWVRVDVEARSARRQRRVSDMQPR
jgi:cellulose synthase/poly-beta-1,6-N-acetylglucosamine synthase-like glycosyltransferase